MSDKQPSKREKSGAEFRKAKKVRQNENKQLGSFMLNYLKRDDGKHETESNEKTVQEEFSRVCRDSEWETPGSRETESSILQVEQESGAALPQSEKDVDQLDVIDELDVLEQGKEVPEVREYKDQNVEDEEALALQEENDVTGPRCYLEKHPEPRQFLSNPSIIIDDVSGTFDPASLVGLKLNTEEKEKLIKIEPCQPSQQALKLRKKQFGERSRYCSQQVFLHDDGTKRKWISYSLSTDSLFCIPCLLFTDLLSRGELARANQGNAFTNAGFSNWKKQHSVVKNHEMSAAHTNAKVAEVLFLQEKTITSCMEQQEQDEAAWRKLKVAGNRNVMTRVVDSIILLGKQGLSFRGHRESNGSEVLNTGNFLELLKYLSLHDVTIRDHLEKVCKKHEEMRKSQTKKGKGRGSKLTFLSNKTQNNVIDVIGKEITSELVKRIHECKAWALIADTTPARLTLATMNSLAFVSELLIVSVTVLSICFVANELLVQLHNSFTTQL